MKKFLIVVAFGLLLVLIIVFALLQAMKYHHAFADSVGELPFHSSVLRTISAIVPEEAFSISASVRMYRPWILLEFELPAECMASWKQALGKPDLEIDNDSKYIFFNSQLQFIELDSNWVIYHGIATPTEFIHAEVAVQKSGNRVMMQISR